ncbi:MAG: exopolysaccharide biosynthesis polyprenyl glycosylphosphotransferase [Lachnospiraceae bacterium]|nr:exopolysaccharide biosynthesis polyprenyl glycosylphosphotransferase [Lachnospiraceae bacterium]MBQ8261790.1 exopolysaccharide biosynthesis polyprenyl glycosylphosphotransferase [Lachnospiraceae bacterium]
MKKLETSRRILLMILSFLSMVIQVAFYACCWFWFYKEMVAMKFWIKGDLLMIAIYMVLLFFFSRMYGGMRIGYLKAWEVFFSQVFSTLCVNVISYGIISLMSAKLVNPKYMLLMMAADLVWIAIWTAMSQGLYGMLFPPRDMLLVSGERSTEDILRKFESRPDKYNICKTMNVSEGYEAICEEVMKRYDALVLWDIPLDQRNRLLKFCYEKSIRVYIMPKIPDVLIRGTTEMHIFDTPMYLIREYRLTVEQRFVKRLIDVICSLILLVIASPFMLLTAVFIKLYDGGPVLYKQIRCTLGGREFKILKFRSMKVDAEKDGVARLATKDDDRITPIGKFIRAVRIDELPQLFNILAGDMSFIGPRPERPEIIAQYVEKMPEFVYRMQVKAGLAGYAQVYGKYNTTPYDKLKLDLAYIENYSIWLDLKLMLLTLKILFKPESTEGVDSAQTTAEKGDK